MIIRLRDGDESAPLFLFPGGAADARELSALASSMRSTRPMLAVELLTSGTRDTNPLTVASIADACFREISAVQQHGHLWHKFADRIESQTIPGSHINMRNGNSVSRLATELDARLDGVGA